VGCRSFGVSQVLVGLHRVGITGLKEAMKKAEESGLAGREAIVDGLLRILAADNLIPERQIDAYRIALWREYLRYRGDDFSEFFTEVEVVIRGAPGEELDRFVETAKSVFAEFELKPLASVEPPGGEGPNPQLLIQNDAVVRGFVSRQLLKNALRQTISDW
jgi:hypothetical protein